MQYPGRKMPKSSKDRYQQPTQGPVKSQASNPQPQGIGRANIAAADAEAQVQPRPEDPQQKEAIGKGRPFGPQRPEKSINQTQSAAQSQGPQEKSGGYLRWGHPSSRPSQPPWRVCS